MTIREFKQYVLTINENKPFFLEFNMDNLQLLNKLVLKSEDKVVKIFTNLEVFDARCTDQKTGNADPVFINNLAEKANMKKFREELEKAIQ